jgi:hypothetical protein
MAVEIERLQLLQSQELYKEMGIYPKWRVLRKAGNKFVMNAYQDARDVEAVLDYVCGIQNWQTDEKELKGNLYRSIMINIEGEGWVTKSDVGVESSEAKVKGEASDAFKRAAFKWGIFRYIYDLDSVMLPIGTDGRTPLTHSGKPLLSPEQISAYCNGVTNNGAAKLGLIYREYKAHIDQNPEALNAVSVLGAYLKTIKD